MASKFQSFIESGREGNGEWGIGNWELEAGEKNEKSMKEGKGKM